ncbi:hypothetical protein [Aristaeella hokkaidonensis]|uniref:SEC-C domain-containing protein n=1 Tax=Aristaeella hokkaidonensis TaxID=3046382 RepID=A0AC61MUS4_9FIRM|nr:hypothetical protein [Aristaeella hokkaidonensis]QUC66110.1 SEC-C domain-containing protein [Aristaeella hokkaidonensis]SNT94887.1 hypothetical protein SAMN06297421_107116 [Aristaeella hokkaidonensis]
MCSHGIEDTRIIAQINKEYSIPKEQLYIHDDELCPCGSGKQYIECCKGKQDAPSKDSNKPIEIRILEQLRKELKNYHCCLHPNKAECKGKIKDAHALQNNKILSLLSGPDHHVMIQDHTKEVKLLNTPNTSPIPIIPFNRKGKNLATVQSCFCDYHDTIVFKPIESDAPSFDSTSKEMAFIYAYKAFIFEYSKQFFLIEQMRRNFAIRPQTFSTKQLVSVYRTQCMRIEEMDSVKKHYDTELLAGTHNGIYTKTICIPYKIGIACYAYVGFDYDLNGQRIKKIDTNNKMHRLSITILPEEQNSYIIISCLENEEIYYRDFFQQTMSSSLDKTLFFFNMMIPLYSENLVLSEQLWKKLDTRGQVALTHLANLSGPDHLKMCHTIGMALRNMAKNKQSDYSQRGTLNLFMNPDN